MYIDHVFNAIIKSPHKSNSYKKWWYYRRNSRFQILSSQPLYDNMYIVYLPESGAACVSAYD